jgi:alkylated DNA nucleotide flippase Atl1
MVCFCIRNGSGSAEKWTSVSPWHRVVNAGGGVVGSAETGMIVVRDGALATPTVGRCRLKPVFASTE